MRLILSTSAAALLLASCGEQSADDSQPDNSIVEDIAIIGDDLAPFGEGYPNAGDPCRRLGEAPATANYLDDSMVLVGCPTEASAKAVGGTEVGNINGVRLVSIPMGDANAGMGENGPATNESGDALVAGTDYNARGPVKCGFDGKPANATCQAGVKRNWNGEQGTHLVEVTKPDGRTRAIFFSGNVPTGADSAQSDGSAGWDFKVTRNDRDESIIVFGPETYVIPDMMPLGG